MGFRVGFAGSSNFMDSCTAPSGVLIYESGYFHSVSTRGVTLKNVPNEIRLPDLMQY